MKKYVLLTLACLLILSGCTKKNDIDKDSEKEIVDKEDKTDKKDEVKDNEDKEDATEKEPQQDSDSPTYIKGILIANKKYSLPKDFNPGEDPIAKEALMRLLNDMMQSGLDVSDYYSGYRNYDLQKQLYEDYKASYGEVEADTFSARPGHSEHQTGLTFDLFHKDGAFVEREPEASWLLEHAHEYGFIVRYQSGRESITGYQAEPWHLRYIGEEAGAIASSKLTLEEYVGAEGGDYR